MYIFAYGIIRLNEEAGRVVARNAKTPGRIYPFSEGNYPVVYFQPGCWEEELVVGDVIEVDPDSQVWRDIVLTEVHASYVPVLIQVEDGDDEYECLAWHYPKAKDGWYEDLIPSGDWLTYIGRK